MAFFVTTAFVVLGVAAHYLRQGRFADEGVTMHNDGLGLLALLVPLQIVIGDLHGLNTLEHQPAKIAAMEANWDTQARMPAAALRHAGRERRAQPLRDRDPRSSVASILTHDWTAWSAA